MDCFIFLLISLVVVIFLESAFDQRQSFPHQIVSDVMNVGKYNAIMGRTTVEILICLIQIQFMFNIKKHRMYIVTYLD